MITSLSHSVPNIGVSLLRLGSIIPFPHSSAQKPSLGSCLPQHRSQGSDYATSPKGHPKGPPTTSLPAHQPPCLLTIHVSGQSPHAEGHCCCCHPPDARSRACQALLDKPSALLPTGSPHLLLYFPSNHLSAFDILSISLPLECKPGRTETISSFYVFMSISFLFHFPENIS